MRIYTYLLTYLLAAGVGRDAVELAATARAECHFGRQYIGSWMLFDDDADSESKFDVNSGEVRSATLGSFICKGKHWQLPYYKVLSVFDNSWYVVITAMCGVFNRQFTTESQKLYYQPLFTDKGTG